MSGQISLPRLKQKGSYSSSKITSAIRSLRVSLSDSEHLLRLIGLLKRSNISAWLLSIESEIKTISEHLFKIVEEGRKDRISGDTSEHQKTTLLAIKVSDSYRKCSLIFERATQNEKSLMGGEFMKLLEEFLQKDRVEAQKTSNIRLDSNEIVGCIDDIFEKSESSYSTSPKPAKEIVSGYRLRLRFPSYMRTNKTECAREIYPQKSLSGLPKLKLSLLTKFKRDPNLFSRIKSSKLLNK